MDLIVTDAEEILGIGDWGVGGLDQARAASGSTTLETVAGPVKPTILIGASTAHGGVHLQGLNEQGSLPARRQPLSKRDISLGPGH